MLLTPDIVAWARRHHGLITLDAWRQAGRSSRSYHRAVDAQFLQPLLPGVAALAGREIGAVERIAAGVLAFAPVLVSHRSGAHLWDGPVEGDRPVDLITTDRRRHTDQPGYVLHRPRDLERLRPTTRHGLPTTSPLRTLLDLGAVVPPRRVLDVLEHLIVGGRVTPLQVERALDLHRRSGRDGVAALAWALAQVQEGVATPDSRLELVCARVFRRAALDGWVFQPTIEGYRVDFAFAAERLIVEVDGWRVHAAEIARWERGLERDLLLAAQGWVVVHLSWAMLTKQPDKAVTRLAAALARRSPVQRRACRDFFVTGPTAVSVRGPDRTRAATRMMSSRVTAR